MMTGAPPEESFAVLVFDMSRNGEPGGERLVPGFATREAARAYAEARVRSSIEELRAADTTPEQLRQMWSIYGESCKVPGDSWSGSDMLDLYIAIPATPQECDWPALTPRLRRFHVVAIVGNAAGQTVWVGGFVRRYIKPSRAVLMAMFEADARDGLARAGATDREPADMTVAHNYELLDPPYPAADNRRPLRRWQVEVDFVCHDVKFGGAHSGVFEWPEVPAGGALESMSRVLVADMLALRGDHPSYHEVSDVLSCKVTETDRAADYPLDPVETPLRAAP